MKIRKILIIILIFMFFNVFLYSEKEPPTAKISAHFLKKYINVQLKGRYFVSYLSKSDFSFRGIIQKIDNRRGYPFFIKFIDEQKEKDEEKNKYRYKFNGFPANKEKDGTIIVKIAKNIIVGVGKPLKGYGDPIDILKMLDIKTALDKAGK
jgi:hypothetical protein